MSCACAQRSLSATLLWMRKGTSHSRAEIEKDAAFMREALDVGLDDGALDLDAVEAVLPAQLHEFRGLRIRVAHADRP